MLILRHPHEIKSLLDLQLRQMVEAVACPEAVFLIVQRGDRLDDLSAQLGFSILANRWTGIAFGQADFTPSFELIQEHANWYEMVFVISDDGYGTVVFVPKTGSDPELLAMCAAYALPQEQAQVNAQDKAQDNAQVKARETP